MLKVLPKGVCTLKMSFKRAVTKNGDFHQKRALKLVFAAKKNLKQEFALKNCTWSKACTKKSPADRDWHSERELHPKPGHSTKALHQNVLKTRVWRGKKCP